MARLRRAMIASPKQPNMDAQALLDELGAETKDDIALALWMPELKAELLAPEILERLTGPKNSSKAFGERMQIRLRELMTQRESFTPDYRKRYEMLLAHSNMLTPHQAYAMASLIGSDSVRGYKELPDKADFVFPRDHEPLFDYQTGWHFFVGSVYDTQGNEYGVECMFWQYTLLPPPVAAQLGLSTLENQILEMHLGVSRAGDKHYRSIPYLIAGTTGLIDFKREPFTYKFGKNSIMAVEKDSLYPLRMQAHGLDRGKDPPVEIEIDLRLDPSIYSGRGAGQGILLQGAQGCQPCCGGVGTLYYSIPNVPLGTPSRLRIGNDEVELTHGKLWMDHQWGTGFIPPGSPRPEVLRAMTSVAEPGPAGWDWFMANFDGERALTMSSLHSNAYRQFYFQTGPTQPPMMSVPVKCKYMDSAAVQHDVNGTLNVTEWIKSEMSPDPVQYPASDTWYPTRWEFQFGEGMPEDLRFFTMEPIVTGGQTGFFGIGAQYQEGAVYLRDKQGKALGRGFAESVNYADGLDAILRLSGLPHSPEVLEIFKPATQSLLSKVWTGIYLIVPSHKAEAEKLLRECIEEGLG